MRRVIYQIGVDVLGFPIFMEHTILEGEDEGSKFNPKKLGWIIVLYRLIKQH